MHRALSRAVPTRRGGGRDRHGRGLRSSVTGPDLPPLHTRSDFFDRCVLDATDYLQSLWPEEMSRIRVLVAGTPVSAARDAGVDRWTVDQRHQRVILYRIPIERLTRLHRDDEWHRRSLIESCVFRAVAELLGRDPWEIAPERFRHF